MHPRAALWLLVCMAPLACTSGDDAPADASSTSGAESSESGTVGTETTGTETTDTGTETTETSGTDTDTDTDPTGEPEGNLLLSDAQLNIAHRGGARLRPENTLVAFEHALAAGADVIEMDLHGSVDGRVVLIHDSTVDRTTEGSGTVEDMSFAELRELDAGYNFTTDGGQTFPYRGMGIQIPALEEVFETFHDRYYLMEIKQPEPSIVPAVLDILASYEVQERVVIASFNQITLDEIRELSPEQFTAMSAQEMITFNGQGDDPGYEPPCLFIQPPWDFVDAALVERGHALGLKVHPWTVNDAPLMQDLLSYGVDGIMTDDPVLLETVLADSP